MSEHGDSEHGYPEHGDGAGMSPTGGHEPLGSPAGSTPPRSAETAAGWYQDPWNLNQRRYWNGGAWTSDVVADWPAPNAAATQTATQAAPWAATPPPPGPADWRWASHPGAVPGGNQPPGSPPLGGPGGAGAPPYGGQPPAGPHGFGGAPAGGWEPVGRWGPDEREVERQGRRRTLGAVIVVTALVAALIGAGIGSQFRSTSRSAAPRGSGSTTPQFGNPGNPGNSGAASQPAGTGLSTGQASAIAAQVDKSLVDVNTQLSYQSSAGAGTGMILDSNGDILTNNHVIDGATSVSVTLVSTGKTYSASVVGTDPTQDVAVIHVKGLSGLTPIRTATATVTRGDPVVAIGNAGGTGGAPSVVTGTIQGINQQITASDANGANREQLSGLIQTNAPIQPGDSGGPLVNAKGAVIGIDTAASSSNQFTSQASTGFAIPIGKAASIAKDILAGKSDSNIHQGLPGFLGVQVVASNPGTGNSGSAANPFGGSGSSGSATPGARVAGVINGSPADTAGISAGDVITSVNGTPVTTPQSLTALLVNHKPGDQVTIGWTDQNGATHSAPVSLATGPAN